MILNVISGLLIGLGLIWPIGPQNAFVISLGLRREHVFLAALVSSCTDTLLIALGVLGFGSLIQAHPVFTEGARWFGAVFLFAYMLICFKRVLWPRSLHGPELKAKSCSTRRMILILLGFGLLNPYAYFGTIVLLGSISTQYHGAAHYYFGIGAILASWVWFFGIAYGAKLIAPLFKSVAAWRVLDFVTGLIMLAVFFKLVVN